MRSWRLARVWAKAVLAALAAAATGCARTPEIYVVAVPVVDLRAQPGSLATSVVHDPLQETQLLYGERVQIIRRGEGWVYVQALEQPEYTHAATWQGYPGWLLRDTLHPVTHLPKPNAVIVSKWATVWKMSDGREPWFALPLGTRVSIQRDDGQLWAIQLVSGATGWVARGELERFDALERLDESSRRRRIILAAQELLQDPYFWGGRSPHTDHIPIPVTGVDCSGLVNLAYRAGGLEIPRDAHEQYLRAEPIEQLEPADLIFLSAADHPEQIVHVMLYAGDGWVIEGPGTGSFVRRISIADRLGRSMDQVHSGQTIEQQTIVFGTYFP